MKRLVSAGMLLLAPAVSAQAIERSAGPLKPVEKDVGIYLRLPNCPEGMPLHVKEGRLVCASAVNTRRRCPSGEIMVGIQPDGELICRTLTSRCELN